MDGWIKIHRKILDWEWYTDTNTKSVFLHLLLKANYKPSKFRGHDIGVGQVVTGRKGLASDLGLSEMQVRTSLDKLKSTSDITIKTTNQFSVVTIVNYGSYQIDDNETTSGITSQPSNEQPTDNQRITTSKEVKKERKKEVKKKDLMSGKPDERVREIFDHWVSVMGKSSKVTLTPKRREKIQTRLKDGYTVEDIKLAINGCANSSYHMGQNPQGTVYDDLELICREGTQIEKFRDNYGKSPTTPDQQRRQHTFESIQGFLND